MSILRLDPTAHGATPRTTAPSPATIVHALPGRLRLSHPAWRHADTAQAVAYTLATVEGVVRAEANPLSGRILVFTRPEVRAEAIAAAAADLTRQLQDGRAAAGGGPPASAPQAVLSGSRRRRARLLWLAWGALAYAALRTLASGRGALAADPRLRVASWALSILSNHRLVRLAVQVLPGAAALTRDTLLSVSSTLVHAGRQSTLALAAQVAAQHARWAAEVAALKADRRTLGPDARPRVPEDSAWKAEVRLHARRSTLVGLGAAATGLALGRPWTVGVAALLATNPRPVRLAAHRAAARWLEGTARRGWHAASPAVAERLARVDALVMVAEGVATKGRVHVVEIVPLGTSQERVLEVAWAALIPPEGLDAGVDWPERAAELADALAREARERGLAPPFAEERRIKAHTVSARVEGATYHVGDEEGMSRLGISVGPLRTSVWRLRESGFQPLMVAGERGLLGVIGFGDPPRPEAAEMVKTLAALGVRPLALVATGRDRAPGEPVLAAAFEEVVTWHDPEDRLRLHKAAAGRRVLLVAPPAEPGQPAASLRAAMGGATDTVLALIGEPGHGGISGLAPEGDDVPDSGAATLSSRPPDGAAPDLSAPPEHLRYLAWVVAAARVEAEAFRQSLVLSALGGVGASVMAVGGVMGPGVAGRLNQYITLATAVNEGRVGAVLDALQAPDGPAGAPGPGLLPGTSGPRPPVAVGDPEPDPRRAHFIPTPLHSWDPPDPAAGLPDSEARRRLARVGPNTPGFIRRPSVARTVLGYLADPLTLALLGASALAAAGRSRADAVAIVLVVGLNAAVAALVERQAEQVLTHLKELAAPRARVIRDGVERVVPAAAVVPGDVVLLQAGDRVPADGWLVEGYSVEVDEAALTGEATGVPKQAGPLAVAPAPPDRLPPCVLWMGTTVVRGRGRMVVTATGVSTQMATLLRQALAVGPETSALQRRLADASKELAALAVLVGLGVGGVGLLRGATWRGMLMLALSMAVAAVPEALPLLATVALARASGRLSRRGVLVRRLAALETLGRVSVVCVDKTGTLTENRLEVVELLPATALAGDDGERAVADAAPVAEHGQETSEQEALRPDEDVRVEASPFPDPAIMAAAAGEGQEAIERALARAARRLGVDPERVWAAAPRLDEIPFDPELGFSATARRFPDGRILWAIKGSVDRVLERCPVSESLRDRILHRARTLAGRRLRVMALAAADDGPAPRERTDFTFVALVAMSDPVRPEARPLVRACQRLGIRVMMLTGDHELTARQVAGAVGIPADGSLTGDDIDRLSDADLERLLGQIGVYARLRPRHKVRIVRALQARGEVVAMVGDGVNDAPALRVADVGMAVGGGASLAEDAAQLVLLDAGIRSVTSAIEEGSSLQGRIGRALQFLLTGNWSEIVLVGGSLAASGRPALGASQILLLNVLTDALPALALAVQDPPPVLASAIPAALTPVETRESQATQVRVAGARDGRLLPPERVRESLALGTWAGLSALGAWVWAGGAGLAPEARQSVALWSIVGTQLAQLGRWLPGAFRQQWTGFAGATSGLALVAIAAIPGLRRLFGLDWPGRAGLGATGLAMAVAGLAPARVFRSLPARVSGSRKEASSVP